MDLEHEKRLTAVEERAKSNSHRLDELEDTATAINRLAASMEVMTVKQGQVADNVEKLNVKVTAMEGKPAKRWEGIVDRVIWAILAAIIAFILARIGL